MEDGLGNKKERRCELKDIGAQFVVALGRGAGGSESRGAEIDERH